MDGWIEIFKTGTHTDTSGRTRTWTEADLERMVEKYDPAEHEAPVVIGHPRENAPAWGWVEKLKRSGSRLLARLRQVAPEFADMVRAGRFKKRSIAVYPDGTLRHVGFLGAQPPAVKGLADISFSEMKHEVYEFTEDGGEQMDIEKLKKQLEQEKEARKKAEQEAKKAAAAFAEAEKKARKKETEAWIEAGIREGRILPAWCEAGLAEFMEAISGDQAEYTFSEGKKQTPAQWFREFLESFSSHPLFSEMAKKPAARDGKDDGAGVPADLTVMV